MSGDVLLRGGRATPPPGFLIGVVFLIYLSSIVTATGKIAFIDHNINSSLVLTQTLDFSKTSFRIAFSFLSCKEGQILYQSSTSGDYFKLFLENSSIYISWKSGASQVTFIVADHLVKNSWYFVDIYERTGDIKLVLQKSGVYIKDSFIANSTFRNSIFSINLHGNPGLIIGGTTFTGCVMEGPYLIFVNNPNIVESSIIWNNTVCPLNSNDCRVSQDTNDCWSSPCENGGSCIDGVNNYTCTCTHLFNGTRCENDLSIYGCTVSPCLNAGTCLVQQDGSRNYKCLCRDGFKGINCENSINECDSSPCIHGTCVDQINNYTCICTGSGFTGPTCETDINECNTSTSICGVGTCFNTIGNYSCSCPTGYEGPHCQTNVNDCSSSPCLNGASCQDGVAKYTCTCLSGYEGTRCETNTDDCKNVACPGQNTECIDGINSHSCECKKGFTGSPGSCVDIDECVSNPCRNGATCHNLENSFNCSCADGYSGTICQFDINECASSPCQNQANCTDLVDGYSCACLAGYNGVNCETNIDECQTNNQPCRNGATCVDLINAYRCDCAAGWTGQHCDLDIDDCAPNPCLNGATCHNYQNYYNCSCVLGYDGKNCSNNIDDCSPNPCSNGGTCQDLVNGYTCNCGEAWMGKNCIQQYNACSFSPCQNGAVCSTNPPSKDYHCACVSGFSGKNCDTNIDDCRPDSCSPPYVCFDQVNNFTCACPIGYTGVNCTEEIDECASHPCQHGSTCTNLIGNYSCKCDQELVNLTKYGNGQKLEFLTGYTGRNCEIDIDECALRPSICLNNGSCKNEQSGGYYCQCGPDMNGIYTTGKNCELRTSYCESSDIVKVDPPACKNGGTCISGDRTFSCVCVPGFTGGRCEINIDECESSPCQYNGTCNDGINGYTCDCIPGITGPNCETDINECASQPCQNGGQCNDKINGYECNCTDTGFNGTECQFDIDDCAILTPCQNNASCTDLVKDYRCNCFLGYEGKNCQIDIDECLSNPCSYNGTCTQRSIQGHPDFSYHTAAGYDCACIPGITGVNCEINIDECVNNTCQFGSTCVDQINAYTCACAPGYRGDRCQTEIDECAELQPCQNGATCKDKVADYDCVCPEFYQAKQYGGKNCTVELTVCENNECKNGATCKPYLVNEATNLQAYDCACLNGYTGSLCQTSTTMTFNNNTFIKYTNLRTFNNTISLRFRTTLKEGVIFAWDGLFLSSTLFSTVELHQGMVYITYPQGDSSNAVTAQHHFPYLVNDASWHEILVVQTEYLYVELKSSKCQLSSSCSLNVTYTVGAPVKTIAIGKPGSSIFKMERTISDAAWIGCMQDITINSVVIVPGSAQANMTQVNVQQSCPRTAQCHADSCSRRGTCVDLWNKYRCDCNRPYYGQDCEQSYTPATFAKGGTDSWTSFDITGFKAALQSNVDVSFFFRSRQTQGLIMFLGNQGNTYMTLELYQGFILSRVVLCTYKQAFYINATRFDNGDQHLARLQLKNSTFTLSVDKFTVTESLGPNLCALQSDYLYLGGKVPDGFLAGRKRRSTDYTIDINDITDLSNVGNFKGTIQDIELNSEKLLFYSQDGGSSFVASNTSSLEQGEVTDDICSSLPCENNATCSNVFFNDFECMCPHGFIGKNCSELDFCKDDSCPASAQCHTLPDGFECISTATFTSRSNAPSIVTYTKNISSSLLVNEISLKLRTVVRNGHIMFIQNENSRYIKVELVGGNVVISYKLNNNALPEEIQVDKMVNDKEWYTVTIKETDQTLSVTVSGNETEVINSTTLSADSISLQTLINYGTSTPTINLGFTAFTPIAHHYYSGCLREVRIGGILLPFHLQSEFKNFTTAEYFSATPVNIQYGCVGGTGCSYSQCQHGTSCLPDYYGYSCNCTGSGYQDDWCQTNINDCETGVCYENFNQGKCVDQVNGFSCKCYPGYTGPRCESSEPCDPACQNGQTCQSGKCACGTDYVGQACQVNASSTCGDVPCQNLGQCTDLTGSTPQFNCTCPADFTGYLCEVRVDHCETLPCQNGGNCTSLSGNYQCTCPPGFSGKDCSVDIDDCRDSPCLHGNQCIDIVNGFICNCSSAWDGQRCENDVDECETQPCQRGSCTNTPGSFQCNCDGTGYTGQYCDVDVDECENSPCQNNASCTNFDGGYNCSCTLGYKGKNCDIPDCDLVSCVQGTCSIYTDQSSQRDKWRCNCIKYYFGELCELKGPCADQPCNVANTLQCTQEDKVNGNFNCECRLGWNGTICDKDVDECKLNYCQHSSTCQNLPGDYTCTCAPGYTDKNCNVDIDDCASRPCQHNAVCTDRVNDFHCDCNNTGYTNKTCSEDIDECSLNICQNSVSCVNSPGSFTCNCVLGYEGTYCNVKNPFDQKVDTGQDEIMWYIIGPILAVILIAIVIGVIVFVMCARSKRATRGTYSPSRQEVTGSRVELGHVLKPPPEERLI